MQIIKPSAEYIDRGSFDSDYAFIESIGRTCYKSEKLITEDSAVAFVKKIKSNRHFTVLEHCWVHFKMYDYGHKLLIKEANENPHQFKYINIDKYLDGNKSVWLVSGSLRAFIELFEQNVSEICNSIKNMLSRHYPELFNEKDGDDYLRYYIEFVTDRQVREMVKDFPDLADRHITHTFRYVCDRGVSHELVRHRPWAISQESTRYCNYAKENEITVIEPCFFKERQKEQPWLYDLWVKSCEYAEKTYMVMYKEYMASPQEARSVLPNSLKTEVVMTSTEEQWRHFLNLRYAGTTGAPHPQMVELTSLVIPTIVKASEGRLTYE